MDIFEAGRLLDIKLPSTKNAVKTAYRKRATEEHPDVSKHPEAKKRFQLLVEAYESALAVSVDSEENAKTDCGRFLNELGLGLGPNVNGRTCEGCDGKGFTTFCIGHQRLRILAKGSILILKGKTETKNHVLCYYCKGTGEIKIYNPVLKKGLLR